MHEAQTGNIRSTFQTEARAIAVLKGEHMISRQTARTQEYFPSIHRGLKHNIKDEAGSIN